MVQAMYGLAYVLVPRTFTSLQSELDRTLAPFKRGGEGDFPRERLAFEDATDRLARLHRAKFRFNADGSLGWLGGDHTPSFDLRLTELKEHLAACRLDTFEGTFAEIEPDFDAFVCKHTDYRVRDPTTGRYGRWLNPIGYWDWWELGGRFNGAITGERRTAGAEQAISSGPNSGRAILGNIVETLGSTAQQEEAAIEANVEMVETLNLAGHRGNEHEQMTAIVATIGCCADEERWFDRIDWHEIKLGTRYALEPPDDADFRRLAQAAFERFSGLAAAGVA